MGSQEGDVSTKEDGFKCEEKVEKGFHEKQSGDQKGSNIYIYETIW